MIDDQKQIEEMAQALCNHCAGKESLCTIAKSGAMCMAIQREAEALYNDGYRKMPENTGDMSDGYHTFNELYHHRAVLFSVICNMMPNKAWKSKLHDTGDMFDGMFIVGIETEQGQATYHYDIDPYWDMFKVRELDRAPKWDGHTPSDAIERIGALSCEGYRKQKVGEWREGACTECGVEQPYTKSGTVFATTFYRYKSKYCPNCGAMMKGDEGK